MTTRVEAGIRHDHSTLADLYRGLAKTFAVWADRRRQRRNLAMLDDRMLADIGLDRACAEHEANKPFWVS